MKIAFDGRVAQRPPHSYRRLLDLMTRAAQSVKLEYEIWTDGDLHAECRAYEPYVRSFPAASEQRDVTAIWSLTPTAIIHDSIPSIGTLCDVNPLLPDGRNMIARWQRGKRFRAQVKILCNSCQRVATDSHDAYSRLVSEFPELETRMHVIPLYATPELQRIGTAETDALLSDLGLQSGYILFVGSFRRHKNWHGLMQAYAMCPATLRSQHPLVFSGAVHRDKRQATALMHKLGIMENTHILGETPEKYMAALYSGAKLFVFPTFMEGFGLPPLEAMQCEVPVIASNRTSVPEVLGNAACYIDPSNTQQIAQTIEQVLADTNMQHERIAAGLAQAAGYNPSRTGNAIMQLLSGLVPRQLRSST